MNSIPATPLPAAINSYELHPIRDFSNPPKLLLIDIHEIILSFDVITILISSFSPTSDEGKSFFHLPPPSFRSAGTKESGEEFFMFVQVMFCATAVLYICDLILFCI